jgi:hypothetical protein
VNDYPLVAVLIPVHNNREDTREFLENFKCVTYPNYKVIITDDGSTDGTEEMITNKHPEALLIKGDGNLWWSLATNVGIEKAIEMGARYVLLAENDHRVSSDFLSALVSTAESNPRSITFSKVYCYDDPKRIYSAGWKINWLKGGLSRIGVRQLDKGQYDIQYDSKAANVNMLINTAFFQDLGMFDCEGLPQYWADVDFTYRAYKKGYRIIYEPKSVIWNKGHATIGSENPQTVSPLATFLYFAKDIRSSRNFRDMAIFCWKHYPKIVIPYILTQNVLRLVISSLAISVRQIIARLWTRKIVADIQ